MGVMGRYSELKSKKSRQKPQGKQKTERESRSNGCNVKQKLSEINEDFKSLTNQTTEES